ncbi:MAG TPA: hypothetical protein VI636_14445 [Candidatus Angelobacter sp.]
MWWNKTKLVVALVMMAGPLVAEDATVAKDQQVYCDYVTQQGLAQRDLLRTPNAVAGFTQPTADLPTQLFWGVSSSLANIRKAGLTMDVARTNCELYSATTSAQQAIQYALPNLEKQALQHRLALIQEASDNLDALIEKTTKMIEAQNVTRPMLFSLQTTRIKLNADRDDTQSRIVALYTPELSQTPLKELVAQKQSSEVNGQKALEKLTRQNDWDVTFSVGARQQASSLTGNAGAYGEVTLSYNLGSHAVNKHLDQAAQAYDNWKTVQQGDVIRNAEVLHQQLLSGISVQENRLKSLEDEKQQVEENLKLVSGTETTAALDFDNQLSSMQLLLGLEIGDATFRLEQMQQFVGQNY